ncbi:AcrR family transcriptional regulator [Paenibacillus sp. DS2015]|uniref:TetR/AcrR family transcriptional regulator n=1 Tax=Paenibacillus sp. DS2015 TaxID=3373917 RepID=UPI003D218060
MPKGFSKIEKERINEKLILAAKQFMATHGFRKMSVEDLTKAAGISKGSFYQFYNSKDELCFEVMEQLEAEQRELISGSILQPGMSAKEGFKQFLRQCFKLFETNPILSNFSKEDFEYLIRKLPEEKIAQHMKRDDDYFVRMVEDYTKQGVFRPCDPMAVSGLFRMIILTVINREDIGEDVYPQTMELFMEMMTSYLVND